MTASAWQTIGIIVGIVLGIGGIYYSQRSASRESARMIAAAQAQAVTDAKAPLEAVIATRNTEIDRLNRLIEARNSRIDQLEDELRRDRGYGGDNRAGR